MIKRISIRQLRRGMYVHEFCGSWMDHPFWRSRFLLRNDAELQRIISGGVQELWIDTAKGLDIESDLAGGREHGEQDEAEQIERELEFAASLPMEYDLGPSEGTALDHAQALYRRSVPKIKALFGEARLGRAIRVDQCTALLEEISESVLNNPGALINVARLKTRDEYTYMHSIAVCALMISLGRQLGLDAGQLKEAGLAGMLHDLGKAFMPRSVLMKPGKLTDAEFAQMKSHPQRGYELLKECGSVGPIVLDVCLHHHEKVDGSGYPHGLLGSEISLFAKMGAVCDVYDAITSVRPYKNGWDPGESLRRMAQWKGHFEQRVFQAFVKTVGIYPVGSLVRLQSGRLAVVTSQDARSLLAPKVKVFFNTASNKRIEPQEIELASHWCNDKVAGCESPDNWNFTDMDLLWGAPRA